MVWISQTGALKYADRGFGFLREKVLKRMPMASESMVCKCSYESSVLLVVSNNALTSPVTLAILKDIFASHPNDPAGMYLWSTRTGHPGRRAAQ